MSTRDVISVNLDTATGLIENFPNSADIKGIPPTPVADRPS